MGQDARATLCWGIYLGDESSEYVRRLDAKARGQNVGEDLDEAMEEDDGDRPSEPPEEVDVDYNEPEGLPAGLEIITTCCYDSPGYILSVAVTRLETDWEVPMKINEGGLINVPKADQALLDAGMRALGLEPEPGGWLLSAFYG